MFAVLITCCHLCLQQQLPAFQEPPRRCRALLQQLLLALGNNHLLMLLCELCVLLLLLDAVCLKLHPLLQDVSHGPCNLAGKQQLACHGPGLQHGQHSMHAPHVACLYSCVQAGRHRNQLLQQ